MHKHGLSLNDYVSDLRLSPRWSWCCSSTGLWRGVILEEWYDVSGYILDPILRLDKTWMTPDCWVECITSNVASFLFYQAWGENRKDIPKRRIIPTVLRRVITLRATEFESTFRTKRNIQRDICCISDTDMAWTPRLCMCHLNRVWLRSVWILLHLYHHKFPRKV